MVNSVFQQVTALNVSAIPAIKQSQLISEKKLNSVAPETIQALTNKVSTDDVQHLLHKQLNSLVTITTSPASLDYSQSDTELALRAVVSNQQQGLLNNENSSELLKRLDNSVADIKAAYLNTSDILKSLGQLGHEQQSFLASSEQRVERVLNSYFNNMNRINAEDVNNLSFELSVKTKEGDTVKIVFNSSQSYDDNTGSDISAFGISYQVDGDLSEAEHQALTQVLSGVGDIADSFFASDQNQLSKPFQKEQAEFNLDFLNSFNHQQLSGFDVALSTSAGLSGQGEANELDLSYNLDQEANQQALTYKAQSGINITDFSLDMATLGGRDIKQMQQYMASLDQNLQQSLDNSKEGDDSAFGKRDDAKMRQDFEVFKSAFSTMSSMAQRYRQLESVAEQQFLNAQSLVADLTDNMIKHDPRYQGLAPESAQALGAGISKLADFDAKFSFSKEPGGLDLRPKVNVGLQQQTEQHTLNDTLGVTQNKTATAQFDYQYTRPDFFDKTESYNINTAIKEGALVGLDQQYNKDIEHERYQFDPDKNQYELKMALNETLEQQSSIRVINDIWLEKIDSKHTLDKKERVMNEDKSESFDVTNQLAHKKLVNLIGDLDKLANNKHARRDYLVGLSNVNFFMANKGK